MAKLKCICGAQLSNTTSPGVTSGRLLRDIDMEQLYDGADVHGVGREAWECYACGRLAVMLPGAVKWYRPEDGEHGHVMGFDESNNQVEAR